MPAIINGSIKINSVTSGATIHFGDSLIIAPKNASKSNSGAGGGLTGDNSHSYTVNSTTNTYNPTCVDSSTSTKQG